MIASPGSMVTAASDVYSMGAAVQVRYFKYFFAIFILNIPNLGNATHGAATRRLWRHVRSTVFLIIRLGFEKLLEQSHNVQLSN
jgi:hypothetical protein